MAKWLHNFLDGRIDPVTARHARGVVAARFRDAPDEPCRQTVAIGGKGRQLWTVDRIRCLEAGSDHFFAWHRDGIAIALDPVTGRRISTFDSPTPLDLGDDCYLAPIEGGRLLALRSSWGRDVEWLAAFVNVSTGKLFAGFRGPLSSGSFSGGISAAPAVRGSCAYVAVAPSCGSGKYEGVVTAIDFKRHAFVWSHQLGRGRCPNGLCVIGSRLLISARDEDDDTSYLVCLSTKTGKLVWKIPWPEDGFDEHDLHHTFTPSQSMVYVCHTLGDGRNPTRLLGAFSLSTGRHKWGYALFFLPRTPPLVMGNVVVATLGSVVGLGAAKGEVRWTVPVLGCAKDIVAFGDNVAIASYAEVSVVNPASGRTVRKHAIDRSFEEVRLLAAPPALYVVGTNAVQRLQ
jgi:outer membrane protein assembly factor BamB